MMMTTTTNRFLPVVLGAFSAVSVLSASLHIDVTAAFAPALSLTSRHRSTSSVGYPSLLRIPPSQISFQRPSPHVLSSPTTSTSLKSAKVLPFVYTGFSGALLYKAAKLATDPAERIVLVAVSALSLLNFGPSDNGRLASAKRAYKLTGPASAGKEKQARQAALTWRKAVRIKIVGQIAGLARMASAKEPSGVMRGAALLMGSVMMYLLSGGGRANHDSDGKWKPLPEKTVLGILIMDAVFCGAALVAARSGAFVAAVIYAFGATVGALEGIPQLAKAIKPKKGETE